MSCSKAFQQKRSRCLLVCVRGTAGILIKQFLALKAAFSGFPTWAFKLGLICLKCNFLHSTLSRETVLPIGPGWSGRTGAGSWPGNVVLLVALSSSENRLFIQYDKIHTYTFLLLLYLYCKYFNSELNFFSKSSQSPSSTFIARKIPFHALVPFNISNMCFRCKWRECARRAVKEVIWLNHYSLEIYDYILRNPLICSKPGHI